MVKAQGRRALARKAAEMTTLIAALGGCNALAGIEEGALGLCPEGQVLEDQRCSGEGWGPNGTGACPAGWKPGEGHCYLLEHELQTWEEARQLCSSRSAKLVTIRSPEELAFLGTFASTAAWTGGNDLQVEGMFTWSNGEPWDYEEAWKDDKQPWDPTGKRDCVALLPTSSELPVLDALSCNETLDVLCELSP